MKANMRRVVVPLLIVLGLALVPTAAVALSVTIEGTTLTALAGTTSINLIPAGQAFRDFGNFRFSTCGTALGCSGGQARALVLNDDGSTGTVKQLSLTDVLIDVINAQGDRILNLSFEHAYRSIPDSSATGYPFGVAMSGVFARPGGAPLNDVINVASTVQNVEVADFVTPATPNLINQIPAGSDVAPSLAFTVQVIGGLLRTSFGQRESESIQCSGFTIVIGSCVAHLVTTVDVTFTGDDTLRLPGSIDTIFSDDPVAFAQVFETLGIAPVPSPAALVLLGCGLLPVVLVRAARRFRRSLMARR